MIDLHLHTTYSDGTRTPEELVLLTAGNYQAIAITDHDTIDGINEGFLTIKNNELSLKLITGVELSSVFQNKEVHILGYGMDLQTPELKTTLRILEEERIERIKKTVDKLTEHGLPLEFSELPLTGLPGRAHVARAMVKKGYVRTIDEAFKNYLTPDRPGYVPRNRLSPKAAIELIHKAKGVAILAHPGLIGLELNDSFLENIPVDGIEVFHSAHEKALTSFYEEFANKRHLLITGGSDCHGKKGKDRELLGLVDLPKKYFDKLLEFMDGIA